jgi:hypothetical protein
MSTVPFQEVSYKTIESLEKLLQSLLLLIESPVSIPDPIFPKFRFRENTEIQAVLLKTVRIVSALHASLTLLREGFVQELMVLLRTIDDFFLEIIFLLGDFKSARTPQQEEFLRDFFQEEFDDPLSPLLSKQKRKPTSRRKIFASLAQLVGKPPANPSDLQEVFRTLHQTHSGYVHGAYPHIMELYGGNPPRFHIGGMKNTPRIQSSEKYLKHYIYRGIQAVGLAAMAVRSRDVYDAVIKLRSSFEADADYKPTNNWDAMLKAQKSRNT